MSGTVTDAPVRLARMRAVTDRLTHLRSDARGNRERILEAARSVFAADGLDAPMRKIARSAQVGPATLYRHFPTKQDLVTAAFTDRMRACYAVVDEGLADPDPWRGLSTVVERLCELQARDRGFTTAFMSSYPGAIDFTEDRGRALHSLAQLARRAKEDGSLRPDFTMDDLFLLLMANSGIQAPTPAAQVAASRRFAALAIQSLRAVPGAPPLPPPAQLRPTAR
jgi:AcrR family transcriptional regulator